MKGYLYDLTRYLEIAVYQKVVLEKKEKKKKDMRENTTIYCDATRAFLDHSMPKYMNTTWEMKDNQCL